MTADEIRLYRYLGYRPLATPRVTARTAPPPDDLPPLDSQGVEALALAFVEDPQGVLARARALWDAELTEESLREAIIEAQVALRAPRETIDAHKAVEAQWFSANQLPDSFTFPLRTPAIPINPERRNFETVGDAVRWALFAGPFLIGSTVVPPAPFRWHTDPQYASQFIYALPNPPADAPLKIALFSDFGTGEYQSLYVARHIEHQQYPYAIHLGDVYYAGRRSEFARYFEGPLQPILPQTKLFTLNANHEMYSGGFPYFDAISARKQGFPHQEQEGSYFALRSTRFQIVGIDTAYFGHGRYAQPDLLAWLEWVLVEGRDQHLMNILLSPDEPYAYGNASFTNLYTSDLGRLAQNGLIDLWFWGNTHYCALFDRSATCPFIGSCIGHGGYPYGRYARGRTEPAPLLFLETQARFPAYTNVRQDRGNNGYCELQLAADGSVVIHYIDWMGKSRCVASLSPFSPGSVPAITVKPFA